MQDGELDTFFFDIRRVWIGWLEPEYPYTIGDVDEAVLLKLFDHLVVPLDSGMRGYHRCRFCEAAGTFIRHFSHAKRPGKTVRMGLDNAFIPGGDVVYFAPSYIVHYIADHHYAPPRAFQEAVLACPELGSPEYYAELQRVSNEVFVSFCRGGERKPKANVIDRTKVREV